MVKATKQPATASEPVTFEEIANKRLRERLESYRAFVKRHAAGEVLKPNEMEVVAELLEQIGLPDYAFARDAEALNRYSKTASKWSAFVADEPAMRERGKALVAEIKEATERLNALRAEAHRIEIIGSGKAASYATSMNQLAAEHPHVLADIEVAVRLRSEELTRRRRATAGAV